MNNQIKTIIFDLGGVFINIDFKKTINSLKKAGFTDIEKKISNSDESRIISKYRLGLISTAEFRNLVRQNISHTTTDQEIDKMWNEMILDIPHEKLDFLLELHKKFTIYLLSNTNELHWEYGLPLFNYKGHNIDDFFDKIFVSFKMHLEKPDTAIFKQVIEQTGIAPNETLFVDDSEENCKAAMSLGIKTFKYELGSDLSAIKRLL